MLVIHSRAMNNDVSYAFHIPLMHYCWQRHFNTQVTQAGLTITQSFTSSVKQGRLYQVTRKIPRNLLGKQWPGQLYKSLPILCLLHSVLEILQLSTQSYSRLLFLLQLQHPCWS
ncbi:hypothetical protein H112_02747 [Trichophyton rubrum D6]|uniref:Uncharacterized protein n=3 Tax=Trichophyton TaxID=5550 RepID=A0A080WPR4_TRIRC|nr:uncharacterized protein TERG_12417 [Trichophyton rubrum CBS 118892]EZF24782.1 hypothetical protein H100_02753 [Trichophyton rubrum MR850]EZF43834.1 hypothetical protein H102_02746 [Trichophyton rubrum CBS 100081]EZF54475.1 hypothetical protein H103_02757 [Trichophyton rubrum CBS 288.86]EZF65148.1 hypothetical protein H104_02736 [Trichophyton rubrum CBS 289.86]EZF75815.1 hypothetical protein H105_02763 [Trichophyton soudanense CBS 452.61]EZF86411.1 hypothetical protein H110_02755 [Trichophy